MPTHPLPLRRLRQLVIDNKRHSLPVETLVSGPTGAGRLFPSCVLARSAYRSDLTVRYFYIGKSVGGSVGQGNGIMGLGGRSWRVSATEERELPLAVACRPPRELSRLGKLRAVRRHLYRTSRLVHQLALAHADCSYPTLLGTFAPTQLLVISPDVRANDWLRDPLTRSQSQDLLEIVDDRYGQSSTLVATQVPVTDWHARFPDPTIGDAILDRLVDNAYRLEPKGESRRKLDSPLPMPTT